MDYISMVRENVNLKEGDNIIEKFLSIVYFHGPISTKELARSLLLPIPVTTSIKKEFIKLNILEQYSGIQMTESGIRYFLNDCGYDGIDKTVYSSLLSDETKKFSIVQNLCGEYNDIFDKRPMVDVTIDQAKCTIETSFKRAILCLENYSLIGKRVLCVGDDDLVSIAMAFLLKKLFPDKDDYNSYICVFEVDNRYIDYINMLASEYSLPIKCVKVDLKDPLPLSFANSFDCFFTDPPYTIEGLSLFLSRGISALKDKKGLKIFLSFGQKPVNENFNLQECILTHGLAIANIFRSFNQYEGASLLGNVSQMIVLESTDKMRSVISSNEKFSESIYTREKKEPNSIYVCKNCKNTINLGREEKYNTIEKLKQDGCPICRGNLFMLQLKQSLKIALPNEKKALGEHILADFYDCSESVLSDSETIKKIMHEAAQRANASIVFEEFHAFNPWGVSGAIIIKESHLTIHTWPEYKYAAVDLFMCGNTLEIWEAFEYLKMKLECNNVEFNDILRGILRFGRIVNKKQVIQDI